MGAGLGLGPRAIAGPMAVMPWRTLTLTLTPHACASFAQENTKRKRGADADSNGVSEKAMKWVRESERPRPAPYSPKPYDRRRDDACTARKRYGPEMKTLRLRV